jgi:5-methylcytosine-specific restriction protein B
VTNLVVILISGEDLTENLRRSLNEPSAHPWAFGDTKRQMQSLTAGTRVAFVDLADEQGRQVNRFTSNTAVLHTQRIVLGTITQGIDQTSAPFFAGYPHEFRFDEVTDEPLSPALTLDETVTYLNTHVPGLDLDPVQLPELIKHAKSNKIGAFIDGAPRKADYFASIKRATPSAPTGDPAREAGLTVTDTSAPSSTDPFGVAAASFRDAVQRSGLVFLEANEHLPQAFLAAVAAKRFAILSGLSGSGKTMLARALGQWLGADHDGPRYLVVPVRPDWTSPEPLLGYEDALLPPSDGRRAWTAPSSLRFMLRAAADPEHLYLLVLDEMNLAHVERYFADVLSGIESGEEILPHLAAEADGYWRIPEGKGLLPLPANLIVVGTVNVDETTYQFSPKVLDRAFTFDFRVSTEELGAATRRPSAADAGNDADLAAFRDVLLDEAWHIEHPAPQVGAVAAQLTDLHRRLSEVGFEFGHRTFAEANRVAATLAAAGIADGDEELDWILMTKVLPRLHGSRRQLESFLTDLLSIAKGTDVEKPAMPRTARKVVRMLDLVRANQYVSFAE